MRRPLVPILLLAAAAAVAALPPALIPFRLRDQHGALHTDRRFAGAPLLVGWGDRRGSDFLKQWSPLLSDSLETELRGYRLRRLDVGHLEGAPFFVKGKIKDTFRRDWPQPVLLDWEGVFAAAYACPGDSCSLLLFDRTGALSRRWTVAAPDSAALARVLAAARAAAARP